MFDKTVKSLFAINSYINVNVGYLAMIFNIAWLCGYSNQSCNKSWSKRKSQSDVIQLN